MLRLACLARAPVAMRTLATVVQTAIEPVASVRLAREHTGESGLTTVGFATDEIASSFPAHVQHELKHSQTVVLPGPSGTSQDRQVVVPLGPQGKVNLDKLRAGVVKGVSHIRASKSGGSVQISVPAFLSEHHDIVAGAVVQSALLSNYAFDRHVAKPSSNPISEFVIAGASGSFAAALPTLKTICNGTLLARNIANERADDANPAHFDELAQKIASSYGLSYSSLCGDALVKEGMSLMQAVGQGAEVGPRLVTLEHWGNPTNKSDVTLVVGKGITFDTGGLNLKPTNSIELMYLDKSGAAVTLAAAATAAQLKIPKNIGAAESNTIDVNSYYTVFALALAENAIGKGAYKPHAIVKSHKGLTVEIGNTDAEGRLVLADGQLTQISPHSPHIMYTAFSYVQAKYKPHTLVDFATLTGACVVALGESTAGLFCLSLTLSH